jgi:4-amino-4-deoxy-L-arabinose transferase-like glycosyltransferase
MSAAHSWLGASLGDDRLLRQFILVLLAVYVVKQAILVLIFPAFTGHDEVAHFAYVQTVVTERRVPELLIDDIPDYFYRYCQYILDWSPCEPENERWLNEPFRFADWGASGIHAAGQQYAANHPPLYYLAAAPVFRVSERASYETQQYLLRALGIPFGLLTVLFAYLTVGAIFPGDRFLGMTVPAFAAFQPQISYEAAMVNNDIVGIAAMSGIIYFLVRGMRNRFPAFDLAALGVALGLALLSKGNLVVAIPSIAFGIIAVVGIRHIASWVWRGAIVAGIAAIISAPWYVYLWRTYGNLDGFEQVEEMQQPWNQPAGTYLELLWNRSFVWRRWQETWGAFGWRRIQLEPELLWAIAIPVILALVGLLIFAGRGIWSHWRRRKGEPIRWPDMPSRFQTLALLLLAFTFVIAYLAIIQFGTRFNLTQARYFFPAVNAVAILLMVGFRTVVPIRLRPIGRALVVALLVLMNVMIFTKYAVPYWHLTEW